jgi:hypothetical protein
VISLSDAKTDHHHPAKADDPVFGAANCNRESPEYWMRIRFDATATSP